LISFKDETPIGPARNDDIIIRLRSDIPEGISDEEKNNRFSREW